MLREQGFHLRRQVPIGRFVADFACKRRRLIIEVDGNQHGYDEGRAYNAARDVFLERLGLPSPAVPNHEVDRALEDAMDTIFHALQTRWGHDDRSGTKEPGVTSSFPGFGEGVAAKR